MKQPKMLKWKYQFFWDHLNSTSLQIDKTFRRVVSAAVEQSRRKASMVAQGDEKCSHIVAYPRFPLNNKKNMM